MTTTSTRDALAAHLVDLGLAEARPGYGHATGTQVADAALAWLAEQTDPRTQQAQSTLPVSDPSAVQRAAQALTNATKGDDPSAWAGTPWWHVHQLLLVISQQPPTAPQPRNAPPFVCEETDCTFMTHRVERAERHETLTQHNVKEVTDE